MSWNGVWDVIFQNKASWGMYPPEELIRFIAAHYYSSPDRRRIKILEIGCGPGGGPSWFVAREGFSLYGIDGSAVAIEKAEERFRKEGLSGVFAVGDIETLPYDSNFFDCVIDVACLQHNSEAASARILREVHRVLNDNGRLFSFTAQAGSWGDGTGVKVDETSSVEVSEGPYRDMNMGLIRFATEDSLRSLYSAFRDLKIEYSRRSFLGQQKEIGHWVLIGQK